MRAKSIAAFLLCMTCLLVPRLCRSAFAAQGIRLKPPNEIIPRTFFGMHVHHLISGAPRPTPWPIVPFGAWRLWDAYVAWPNLEPKQGRWDFRTLDKYVALAEKHDVAILMPLGLSPPWASSDPNGPWQGHPAPPRSLSEWQNYVRTVATRYRGKIHDYEIWNEPNMKTFYSGSIPEMVQLARVAYATLKGVDPTVTVCSPAATTAQGVKWLDQYLKAGGGKYADAICYHFYIHSKPPEAMLELIDQVKAAMARSGVSGKPIWNTETGWANPSPFPQSEAAAYVARSYILQWAAGVSQFYWYAWDNHKYGLQLTQADYRRPTSAGVAYGVVENWLVGATMTSCGLNNMGIWICAITRSRTYHSWILWDPDREASFSIPAQWNVNEIRDLSGAMHTLRKAKYIDVGQSPILLVSSGTN